LATTEHLTNSSAGTSCAIKFGQIQLIKFNTNIVFYGQVPTELQIYIATA